MIKGCKNLQCRSKIKINLRKTKVTDSATSMNITRFSAPLMGIAALFLSGLAHAQTPTATNLPTTPEAWAQAAQNDIRAAAQITRDNHPGYVDPANPQFKTLVATAEANGLHLARQVRTAPGYVAALRRFSNTLQDGHAGAFPTLDSSLVPKPKWPGFVAVWRGDAMLVYKSLEGGPPTGARITRCDGVAIRTLVLRNVFSFRGRPSEPGNWWVDARRLFIDGGNPFITPPKTCTFVANNRTIRRTLDWKDIDPSFTAWNSDSYNGVTLPVGMTIRPSGVVWIAMPEFEPDEAQQAAYRAIVSQITEQREAISNAKAIVLDLRDNQGGSSQWSKMIANALWGSVRRNRLAEAYFGPTSIVRWRTSNGNARHVEAQIPRFIAQGMPDLAAEWTALYKGMDAARVRGEDLFTEGSEDTNAPPTSVPQPSASPAAELSEVRAPVYVIVPGQCASACLNAVDTFKLFNNVKLIGAPSSADSTYMDIRRESVPSGLASVIIPNKFYVGAKRGPGFAYRPDIEVRAIDWSTEVFEDVVLTDLQARQR
jgi:hypothetical protein